MTQELHMIKQELVEILACPQCKGPVELNQEQNGLLCRSCSLLFPIRDDIPIMLIDEAQPLPQDEQKP
nr:Trm112 family protein [uncultured Desulfobulbus sp.]